MDLLFFVVIRILFFIGILVGVCMIISGWSQSRKTLSIAGKIIGFSSLFISIGLTFYSFVARIGV